jgi:hypothetical protein
MPLLAVLGEISVPFRKTRPPVSELSSKVYLEGALGGFQEGFHGQNMVKRMDFMGFTEISWDLMVISWDLMVI